MTTPIPSDTVTVPRRLLEELASYLGPEPEATVVVPGNGAWTRSMIEQLRPEIRTYRGAVAAFDLAAGSPGELVTLDEIEAACGLSRKQISSDLGAMSKATRRLFGTKAWPMRAMQSNSGMNYLMRPQIAEWWLS